MTKQKKIKVFTYVQGANESGRDFCDSVNGIMDNLEKEAHADPDSFQFQYTSASDGRQTCNIIYKTSKAITKRKKDT